MVYPITEHFIDQNRSYEILTPRGIIVHSTATPGATAEAEQAYFDRAYRGASAHFFVDWDSIINAIPLDEVAWGAGPTANHAYIHIEMCEPFHGNPGQFQEVWNRTVWLCGLLCSRNVWNPLVAVHSHLWVTENYPSESDHSDPFPYFNEYGVSWQSLIDAIAVETAAQLGGESLVAKLFKTNRLGLIDTGIEVQYGLVPVSPTRILVTVPLPKDDPRVNGALIEIDLTRFEEI